MFVFLRAQPVWWGLVLLFIGALIEYVFPPFPGDSILLVGAVLIPKAGWPITGVFAATLLGSMCGATVDWWVGYWLSGGKGDEKPPFEWLKKPGVESRIDWLRDKFEQHGSVYIAVNRFVPAFRALFFVAAGLSRLSLTKVLAFGALSAALWNGAILGLGYLVGYNLERIYFVVEEYSIFVLSGLGLLAAWGVYRLFKNNPVEPD